MAKANCPFLVRSPREDGSFQPPLCPPPRPVPRVIERTKGLQRKWQRKTQKKSALSLLTPLPQRSRRRAWEATVADPHPRCPPPQPLPELTPRHLALCAFFRQGWGPPPHVCGGEEVQNRLAAPRIGEEEPVPDLEPGPCLSLSPPAPPPTGFSAGVSSAGSTQRDVPTSGSCTLRHQHLGCGQVPGPLQVLGRLGGGPVFSW